MLDVIIEKCERATWRLFDIPERLWGDLADLLLSADPDIALRRANFASLIDARIDGPLEGLIEEIGKFPDIEFLVHAIRIGSGSLLTFGNSTRGNISNYVGRMCGKSRALFFLLLRVARETGDRALVHEVLSLGDQPDESGNGSRTVLRPDRVPGLQEDEAVDTLDVERYIMDLNLTYREAMDFRWAIDVARDFQPGT